jgi:hypothetical protein
VKRLLLTSLLAILALVLAFYASTVFQAATLELGREPVPLFAD